MTVGSEVQAEAPTAIKRYEINKLNPLTFRKIEVQHDGKAILVYELKTRFMRSPIVYMHHESEYGPIVAGVNFPSFSSGLEVIIGDPHNNPPPETNIHVSPNGMFSSSWHFTLQGTGQTCQWKKAHDKKLESLFLKNDYMLVDPSNNDKILAVYVHHNNFAQKDVGHIDWMEELGNDFELQAITAILGVEEKLRGRRATSRPQVSDPLFAMGGLGGPLARS